jgi:hypothetical protein
MKVENTLDYWSKALFDGHTANGYNLVTLAFIELGGFPRPFVPIRN